MPSTQSGRVAGVCALLAAAIMITINVLMSFESAPGGVVRAALVLAFFLAGVSALVFGIRALRAQDRCLTVWGATIIGALATLLLIAEFTVME